MSRPPVGRLLVPILAAVLAVLAPSSAAADDSVAWSVSPSDETGDPGDRTRFDLELDPRATVTDHVVVANASTTEQTFVVYGADAFNTAGGGYDLRPRAETPVAAGAWVTMETDTVTIPALTTAVVPFTVTVPAGATPGDHPGGIVVSLAGLAPDAEGVVIDSRVAVRLNVRVSGELAPALTVRTVTAEHAGSPVPFGSAPATVSYEVRNTGNVKVIGQPRIRITGPFGVELAESRAEDTREVLPGDSFTVVTELSGVAPLGVLTAVVDVAMAAAPGPGDEIPLVSSTGRTTFLAVPWTGIGAVVLAAALIWAVIRTVRRRRRTGEETWQVLLDEARAEVAAGTTPVRRDPPGTAGRTVVLALALAVAGIGVLQPSGPAAAAVGAAVNDDDGVPVELSVPPAPTPTPTPTPSPTPGPSPTPTITLRPTPAPTPSPSASDDEDDGAGPGATDEPTPDAGRPPDGVWNALAGRSPGEWALLGLAAAAVATALARFLVLARRRRRTGVPAVVPEAVA